MLSLDEGLGLDMIGMKKVTGGALQDSLLVEGVAFKKTFAYAGFEQMTKAFENPKIVLLNVELELKAERDNAEVRVTDVKAYQQVVDAEWDIIYDKLAKIVASGAQARPGRAEPPARSSARRARVPSVRRSCSRASRSATWPRSILRTVASSVLGVSKSPT